MLEKIIFETEKLHEQRVVSEANNLAIKINALENFAVNNNPTWYDMNCVDKSLIIRQLRYMNAYHKTLENRIENLGL